MRNPREIPTPSSLEAPRIVDGPEFLIAGFSERYTDETSAGIPAQWRRFEPWIGRVPGQIGNVSYGVCYNNDSAGNMDYLTGVEVEDLAHALKELFSQLRIPANRYAVFTHRGNISTIRATWAAIFGEWVPASGHKTLYAPSFERYDERFNPRTGNGGLEIWLPIS